MLSTKAQRPRHGPGPFDRLLGALAVLAVGLSTLALLTASGCAGGGGGGDDAAFSDEPSPPFPSGVQYTANSLSGGGLAFALDSGGGVAATFFLEGTYAKASHAFTLRDGNVPRIGVVPDSLPFALLYPAFDMLIEEPFRWTGSEPPVTGQFRTVPANGVRLAVTADAGGSGLPGVDVAWIEFGGVSASTALTWDELEAVLDDPGAAEPYVLQAAFAYAVLRDVFDQVRIALDATEFVTLHDAELTAAGDGVPITRPCEPFPFTGTTGHFDFTWIDGPGEFPGALGANDHFTQTFDDCWRDDAASPRDRWLRSGTVDFRFYAEDTQTVVLGFEQVLLHAVKEARTDDVAGTPTPGADYTADTIGTGADAGFRLLTAPDTSTTLNLGNAVSVASGVIDALQLPRDVGDLGVGLLAGFVADPAFEFCPLGGSLAIDPVPTAASGPGAYGLTFNACRREPSDPVTFDGVATVRVDGVTGGTLAALATDTYTATLRLTGIDLDIEDVVGTSRLTGGTAFTRAATGGDLADRATALPAPLAVEEAGITRTLSAYTLDFTRTASGAYGLGDGTGNALTLDVTSLAGPLAVTVAPPVTGTDPDPPASGGIAIEAPDGSALDLTVNAGDVVIGIDTDGDGIPDDSLGTPWLDLN